MWDKLQAIVDLLCCPDDGSPLKLESRRLQCALCRREYPVHNGEVVELLPSIPAMTQMEGVHSSYSEGYLEEFRQLFRRNPSALAWGAPECNPRGWVDKRLRQVSRVLPLIAGVAQEPPSVICDVSAGAGYYTFALAPCAKYVLHCDLSCDSLNYALTRAHTTGVNNLIFLRIDYFRLPFRRSLQRLVCFDTLIRGLPHDRLLLESIQRALAPGGLALVDFHNWWHNPLRRLGLLRQNFGDNRSYTRRQVSRLMADEGVNGHAYFPFHQEVDSRRWPAKALAAILPPTRHLIRFSAPMYTA